MANSITPLTPASGIAPLGAERRRGERTPIQIQAILRFDEHLQVLQGTICDLSVGGTGFICHQAVAAHSRCKLQFMLPALPQTPSHTVSLPAMAVYSMQVIGQSHQYRVNLQFVNLPPAVRHHIEALIRQSLGRS